jgi:Mg2+ and Co2+ transporter CorA
MPQCFLLSKCRICIARHMKSWQKPYHLHIAHVQDCSTQDVGPRFATSQASLLIVFFIDEESQQEPAWLSGKSVSTVPSSKKSFRTASVKGKIISSTLIVGNSFCLLLAT